MVGSMITRGTGRRRVYRQHFEVCTSMLTGTLRAAVVALPAYTTPCSPRVGLAGFACRALSEFFCECFIQCHSLIPAKLKYEYVPLAAAAAAACVASWCCCLLLLPAAAVAPCCLLLLVLLPAAAGGAAACCCCCSLLPAACCCCCCCCCRLLLVLLPAAAAAAAAACCYCTSIPSIP